MKSRKKLISFFAGLSLALFLLCSSIIFSLNFKLLYSFDVDNLNISAEVNMPKEKILKNYDILIDYLSPFNKKNLEFKDFPMSQEGRVHFIDVKNLFNKISFLWVITFALSLITIAYLLKIKDFSFLKYSYSMLIMIPLLLFIPFAISFDKTFTKFHEIFFSNDYWLFDPVKDPIINVLPEKFFLHEAILILFIMCIFSLVLFFIHKSKKRK